MREQNREIVFGFLSGNPTSFGRHDFAVGGQIYRKGTLGEEGQTFVAGDVNDVSGWDEATRRRSLGNERYGKRGRRARDRG